MMNKERMIELAQNQLDAYNQGNIDNFCENYHQEVEAYSLPDNNLIVKGIEQFRKNYGERFKNNPKLHCELKSRTVLTNSVLDEEWVTGVEGATGPSHVVAIYHFKDNLIYKIWFTR